MAKWLQCVDAAHTPRSYPVCTAQEQLWVVPHCRNLAILLDGLDVPIVSAGDPRTFGVGQEAWTYERAITRLVTKIIRAVPHA